MQEDAGNYEGDKKIYIYISYRLYFMGFNLCFEPPPTHPTPAAISRIGFPQNRCLQTRYSAPAAASQTENRHLFSDKK